MLPAALCDNLAFIGDYVIRRKHTVKAKRELPGLVTEIVQPLQEQRIRQNDRLAYYHGVASSRLTSSGSTLAATGSTSKTVPPLSPRPDSARRSR